MPADPKLPVLTLDAATAPTTVTIGMTATVQLVVANLAGHPATAVSLGIPLPDGVKLLTRSEPTVREITALTKFGARTYTSATDTLSYTTPGNGGTPRTTTTAYDTTFHAFPVSETNPLSHVRRAAYDFRMGTMTEVAGPNATLSLIDCTAGSFSIGLSQEVTCATYDTFGRMLKVIRPGDSLSDATFEATYYDSAKPFLYIAVQKVTTVSGDTRHENLQFYDGLGRKVQEKREPIGWGAPMLVTDTRYDALGRVTATSQPRSNTAGWSAFIAQPNSTTELYRETSSTYDALGRPGVITAPDGTTTSYGRWP